MTNKPQPTVPCKWCGVQTPMLGTRLCDRCWELERQVVLRPDLARAILDSLDKKPK